MLSSKYAAVMSGLVLVAGLTACADEGSTAADSAGIPAELRMLLGPAKEASGEAVRLGFISGGSSPAFDFSVELRAAEATAKYLNRHQGGIAGRPIELVTCETHSNPAQGADCANQMVENDVAAVTINVSAVGESILKPLDDAAIPVMFFQSSVGLQDTDSTFVLSNTLGGGVALPVVVADQIGGAKVSPVVVDTPNGRALYESLAPAVFERAGLELDPVYVAPGTPDMLPQVQRIVSGGAEVVHVVCAGDAFAISAFQGFLTAGYEGSVTTYSNCVNNTVRSTLPAGALEGVTVSSVSTLGATDDPEFQLFEAVAQIYGEDVDTSDSNAIGSYIVLSSLAAAVEGISGEINPASIIRTIKAMPEMKLPAGGGMTFRCDGSVPNLPAVCVNQMLVTTLDEAGEPTEYEVVDLAPVLGP